MEGRSVTTEKPSITPELIARIQAYWNLPGNGVGGSLHVVLDDGNVEDVQVRGSRDSALGKGDAEGAAILDVLLTMSRTQRTKLSRMDWYKPWRESMGML
jgi:hypothetical protein